MDTYTYKQVLIGIRNEYLLINKKLEELKKYSIIFENSNDYYFNIYKDILLDDRLPELTLDRNVDDGLFGVLLELFGFRTANRAFMVRNNNGVYYPLKKHWFKENDFDMVVIPTEEEKFRLLTEEILSTDFARYMKIRGNIYSSNNLGFPKIILNDKLDTIDIYLDDFIMSYVGRTDLLKCRSLVNADWKVKPITEDIIKEALSIEFPRYSFSPYYQSIIDKNLDNDREIVMSDNYKPKKSVDFIMIDDGKKLILSKNKK